MTAEYLPPKRAAECFGIPRTTLSDWARRGLIGKFKEGRTVRYVASDIADVLRNGTTPRQIVPLSSLDDPADDSWRSDPLWAGTPAARAEAAR